MKLIDQSGKEVLPGATITNFRGEDYILKGSQPPRSSRNSGYVYVTLPGEEHTQPAEFYVNVFNLQWEGFPCAAGPGR